MKAIIVSGSRNTEGQTAKAMRAFEHGLEAGGAQVEEVFLPTLEIERCRQCDENGWGLCRSEGRCIIEDDFARVVDKVKEAGGAVFANPVYFGDQSESLRAFLDRLRRISIFYKDARPMKGKPAVAISVASGGGGGAPNSCLSMEKTLTTIGFDVVDVIPVRRQNLDMKVKVCETTGKWFAGKPTS